MLLLGPALALALASAPRIAVMPIAPGDAISDKAAGVLTESLAAELRQQSGAEVVTARDLNSVLSLEKQKQALGCTSDSCMAEIAGAAGADRVVAGDVARLGESLILQLRMLDARKARVIAQSRRRYKNGSFDDVLDALPAVVGELLGNPGPASAGGGAPPPRPASVGPSKAAAEASADAVLHYRRADGRYDGVRLFTWESFERSDELRQPQRARVPGDNGGVLPPRGSRLQFLDPSGAEPDGVYWRLPASRYRNGRVNFVIANGGSWEECGAERGRFWLLQDGREAWATAPACEIHLSAPAAAPRADTARPAPAPLSAPRLAAPAGQVVLHYHRNDGNYDNVDLLTWESFERTDDLRRPQPSNLPRNNQSLGDPRTNHLPLVAPHGRDAFGAYWTLPAATYRNGRVNFVVAVGNRWDECGVDTGRYWIAQDGREAWYMGAPDCEVFTDPDAAVRARASR